MISQAACVPFRTTSDGFEILLITTRKGKWSLPKGIIDPGETARRTACKEALEEAGVEGTIEGESIGGFTYHKWGEQLKAVVFLLNVHTMHEEFDEDDFRSREWLTPAEAQKRIRKRMRAVLEKANAVLSARYLQ